MFLGIFLVLWFIDPSWLSTRFAVCLIVTFRVPIDRNNVRSGFLLGWFCAQHPLPMKNPVPLLPRSSWRWRPSVCDQNSRQVFFRYYSISYGHPRESSSRSKAGISGLHFRDDGQISSLGRPSLAATCAPVGRSARPIRAIPATTRSGRARFQLTPTRPQNARSAGRPPRLYGRSGSRG